MSSAACFLAKTRVSAHVTMSNREEATESSLMLADRPLMLAYKYLQFLGTDTLGPGFNFMSGNRSTRQAKKRCTKPIEGNLKNERKGSLPKVAVSMGKATTIPKGRQPQVAVMMDNTRRPPRLPWPYRDSAGVDATTKKNQHNIKKETTKLKRDRKEKTWCCGSPREGMWTGYGRSPLSFGTAS